VTDVAEKIFAAAFESLQGKPASTEAFREIARGAVRCALMCPRRQGARCAVVHKCTSAVVPDLRIDQLPELRLEPLVRPLLIRPHQARITGHVGGEDRSEAADRGHGLSGGRLA
jgi:hypothetical protein